LQILMLVGLLVLVRVDWARMLGRRDRAAPPAAMP